MTDLGISGIGDAELIASGGSALVYAATDDDGQRVAVKVLRGFRGEEVRRRFEREQSASDRLREHPSIIDVHRSGVSLAGEPFLIMPLLHRGSLADELDRDGAFSVEQAIEDVAVAADAIDFAHRRGVLHRDLKPGNLLRSDDGQVVVTDFGIARVVDAGITSATIGASTPLYAAPELLEQNDASEQSDVYSLGALLYALIAGAPPFADSPNIWATIGRIREEDPAPIDGVPLPIMRTITQAMAKNPTERPPTAQQFRTNLLDATGAADTWTPPKPAEMTIDHRRGPEVVPVVPSPTVEYDAPAPRPAPAAAPPPGRAPSAPVSTEHTDRDYASSGLAKFAWAGLAVLLVVGAGWFAISRALGSETASAPTTPTEPIDSSLPPITPFPTVDPAVADDVDAVPTAEPDDTEPLDPDATPAPVPTPADSLVSFDGRFFQAYFPEGWSVARSDIDVGYGFRSEFVADGMYLNVDTTPSEQRSTSGSIRESAQEIAASISSASSVNSETIDGLTMHSFTFRNNRGIDSIDIFFEVDGDGYAIVAGSSSRPETAFAVARQVALTVRSSA